MDTVNEYELRDRKAFENIICMLVFIISLIMTFEVEIRSIGHLETDPVPSINLFGFWMSDLGLILPILFVFFTGKFKSVFFKNRLSVFLIFSFIYGIIIFFARNNPSGMLGVDLRVFLSLFTGLSMGAILQNKQKTIAASLTLVSASAIFIATAILFALPGADFIHTFVRTTHPSAFMLFGFPIVFTAPSMIFSILLRNRVLIAVSWFSAGVSLLVSILILQTRSLTLIIMLGIILAIATTIIFSSYFNLRPGKGKTFGIVWKAIGAFLIFTITTSFYYRDSLNQFLLRMHYASATDVGVAPRLAELPAIFTPMSLFDHIIGMGFNPISSLIDWQGNSYNITHFGILNIWWRLGFPVFFICICLFTNLVKKWLNSLKYLYVRSLQYKVNNQTIALIVCTPGVMTLFFVSCMSGGWGISPMISLGILWGIFRKIAYSEYSFL